MPQEHSNANLDEFTGVKSICWNTETSFWESELTNKQDLFIWRDDLLQ